MLTAWSGAASGRLQPKVEHLAYDELLSRAANIELLHFQGAQFHDLLEAAQYGAGWIDIVIDQVIRMLKALMDMTAAAGVLGVLHPLLLPLLPLIILPRAWALVRSTLRRKASRLRWLTPVRQQRSLARLLVGADPAEEIRAHAAGDFLLRHHDRMAALRSARERPCSKQGWATCQRGRNGAVPGHQLGQRRIDEAEHRHDRFMIGVQMPVVDGSVMGDLVAQYAQEVQFAVQRVAATAISGKCLVERCAPQTLVVVVAAPDQAHPEPERQLGDHFRRGGRQALPAQLVNGFPDLGYRAVVQIHARVIPPVVPAEQVQHALVKNAAQDELQVLQRAVERGGHLGVPAEQPQRGHLVAAAERLTLGQLGPATAADAGAGRRADPPACLFSPDPAC
ncbi:hypothetical protein ACFFV7_53430 [Nonomuraea spiralis]|uniref:Uncharacterized protein n=1 Tax=Nonomuraea spiralis TaxID=46182 RepID=A0ABV5IZS8_9ACTN|nr:hypothetical protein [Nonomuraea spiralis]GGT16138.1 hypothetical protein GCM10010176_070810 [Nonomuraea spiralis]